MRIRKWCKGEPDPKGYALKKAQLVELERLCQRGAVDVFYGDESHLCSTGYTPYGWQFLGEAAHTAVEKGYKINV